MATENQGTFPGFQLPKTTPVPDEVFDVLMPQLSGAELKVLLYICRRTFGFKKESDNISLQQIATGITTRDGRVLDRGTGLCLTSITNAVSSLEQKEIIVREKNRSVEKGFEASTYSLKFAAPISKKSDGGYYKKWRYNKQYYKKQYYKKQMLLLMLLKIFKISALKNQRQRS
jgi:phage replication O-like protein O